MKKHLFLLLSLSLGFASAQVAIGKENTHSSALLEFEQNNGKGIILPTTTGTPTEVGAITFNVTDGIIYYTDKNSTPVALSGQSEQKGKPRTLDPLVAENPEEPQGVIIGAQTSNAEGVLILESNNKALVLPHVNDPVTNMPSPEPGTICYDTASKSIAVFDGTNWYFWNHIKTNN
ncbi:hypothetical protein KRX57_03585 [Weeksellaceae bacterium TAE3-ERU29]|nr:hypothetical protein [Weeksellaceae bacterium TAE3-ERU29]